MEENPYDILIHGGMALTMAGAEDVIENPVIGIRDGRIALICQENDRSADTLSTKESIDASGCIVMPGLVNAHTHIPMVCFRGLADDLPLMTWLNDHIFPAEARYITRDVVYAASRLAIAEMILSGTTTFCDGYFYESAVAQAALDSGMRSVVAQGFIDFPTPDNPDPGRKMKLAEAFAKKWRDRSPLITPAFFCHAPYTCSSETLCAIKAKARELDLLFMIHLSETREEVSIIKERYGLKPVAYLDSLGLLDEKTICVHCIWLDAEEMDILASRGVKIAHTPESNMKLASGIAPIPELLARGVVVGIGTDGCASNNNLDMFQEMDMVAKIHKVSKLDPTVMNAREALEMSTIGAAAVLGLEKEIGTVEVGKAADLILVDMQKPHLTPLYHPYSQIVYSASGADVATSIIHGRIIMRDRRILDMDLEEVMDNVKRIGEKIRRGDKP